MSKPLMRGFLTRQVKKDLLISFALGAVACTAWRLLYVDPVKQQYADFYKTYDPIAHFESMKRKGLLQSAAPDDD